MQCPKCQLRMSEANASGVVVHRCNECKGAWVSAKALNHLLRMEGIETQAHKIIAGVNSAPQTSLLCASCDDEKLHLITVSDFEIEACACCYGMFFDSGELAKVVPNKYKEDLDLGVLGQADKLDLASFISNFFPWN